MTVFDAPLILSEDMPQLDGVLEQYPNTRLLIFDPLSAYLGVKDSHRDSDVRQVLGPLTDLAAKHEVSILGITHLNKAAGNSAIARFMGSTGIIAAARAAIKELKAVLKSAEKTAAAHRKNVEELDSLRLELLTARNLCVNARKDCPALDVAEFNRLAEVMGWGHVATVSKGNADAQRWRIQSELCGKETLDIRNPWADSTPTINQPYLPKIIPG